MRSIPIPPGRKNTGVFAITTDVRTIEAGAPPKHDFYPYLDLTISTTTAATAGGEEASTEPHGIIIQSDNYPDDDASSEDDADAEVETENTNPQPHLEPPASAKPFFPHTFWSAPIQHPTPAASNNQASKEQKRQGRLQRLRQKSTSELDRFNWTAEQLLLPKTLRSPKFAKLRCDAVTIPDARHPINRLQQRLDGVREQLSDLIQRLHNAANKLIFENQKPSQKEIRDLLSTAYQTTINLNGEIDEAKLQQWLNANSGRFNIIRTILETQVTNFFDLTIRERRLSLELDKFNKTPAAKR